MKIKALDGDPADLVILRHKRSDGMCSVAIVLNSLEVKVENQKPITGDIYTVHKRHLQTPNFRKSRPPRIQHLDPLDRMKLEATDLTVATLQ
jgi:hypothetical protein